MMTGICLRLSSSFRACSNDSSLAWPFFSTTNAFGNFQVAVPKNSIDVLLDGASAQPAFVLVSQTLTLAPTVDTNLGNITMQPGYIVSGHVQRASNGLAVAGVDIDVKNTITGDTLCDPEKPITIVPTVALDAGALVSGIVKSFDNVIQVNADVDVYRQATGEIVPSFADNTGATGAYAVVVPLGTVEIAFRPPSYSVPLGSDVHSNLLVTADTALNAFLPSCPAPNNYVSELRGVLFQVQRDDVGVDGPCAKSA